MKPPDLRIEIYTTTKDGSSWAWEVVNLSDPSWDTMRIADSFTAAISSLASYLHGKEYDLYADS